MPRDSWEWGPKSAADLRSCAESPELGPVDQHGFLRRTARRGWPGEEGGVMSEIQDPWEDWSSGGSVLRGGRGGGWDCPQEAPASQGL